MIKLSEYQSPILAKTVQAFAKYLGGIHTGQEKSKGARERYRNGKKKGRERMKEVIIVER